MSGVRVPLRPPIDVDWATTKAASSTARVTAATSQMQCADGQRRRGHEPVVCGEERVVQRLSQCDITRIRKRDVFAELQRPARPACHGCSPKPKVGHALAGISAAGCVPVTVLVIISMPAEASSTSSVTHRSRAVPPQAPPPPKRAVARLLLPSSHRATQRRALRSQCR
jgi:hypothetical protein